MPPSAFQSQVLKLIARNRSPESHVAGGLALNMNFARYSFDIDIFNDVGEEVWNIAERDAQVLRDAGFQVEWRKEAKTFRSASVSGPDGETILDWAMDSDFRFFPTEADPVLGWRLHPFDLATNKALAAAARRAPRDAIDLVTIHENLFPLGAVVWAAVAKDPGFTPLLLTDMIGRFARYRQEELNELGLEPQWDAADLSRRIKAALTEATTFVEGMPADRVGVAFLKEGRIVQPDPDHLAGYEVREATRRGVWPLPSDA